MGHSDNPAESIVKGFIQEQGGVSGLISKFEKEGLGPIVRSWVGKEEKQPISAGQIHRALGFETLQKLGAKVGLSADATAEALSELLPKTVGTLTAGGATRARWDWRY
ncbi:YidB family protein [Rhodomicrobium lacus]|uniref:YidB family protein n=1 Tax=Rhodomicrobium lacus TaxID=2498452 RepID=UPI000F8EDC92|nr:YidB family protein [Rhodomicrobium lacus]